jgi:bifunctional non-homologous end joining protein LigD
VKGHWVKPKLVAEVAFTEWTDDGRVRHPVFHGLRTDKDPATITRDEPVHTAAVEKKPPAASARSNARAPAEEATPPKLTAA